MAEEKEGESPPQREISESKEKVIPPPPPPEEDLISPANEEAEAVIKDLKDKQNQVDEKLLPPPPPPPPPPPLHEEGEVRAYDLNELRSEIEAQTGGEGEEDPNHILSQIKAERELLEKERQQLKKEREQKESKEEKPEEIKPEVRSFAKERRKRKELEKIRKYLMGGEYALIVVFVLAQLYAEGISANPLRLPLENTFYLIIIFFLVIKIETFFFRFMDMELSGTLQRKSIGVELFKAMEWPVVIGWAFVVAIFMIPPTHGFINILIKVFSGNGEVIPISKGFLPTLISLFVAHLVSGILWIVYLSWYKKEVLGPELKAISEPFEVREVFLITSSGLLIKRASRYKDGSIDDDIISSMLTAVGEFVKDSFGSQSEEGELDELQYGKLRIVLEYGNEFYLAVVVRGQESRELRSIMKRTLSVIHKRFAGILENWDGNLEHFRGAEGTLKPLLRLQ